MLFAPLMPLLMHTSSPAANHIPADPTIGRDAPPKVEFINRPYAGTVTAVTKDSITVTTPRYIKKGIPGGSRHPIVVPAQPPKRFVMSEILATGGIPRDPRPKDGRILYRVQYMYMYRLADVKVGDVVDIRYAHVDGVDTCDHICIHKRPGGHLPPLPEGVEPRASFYSDPPTKYWTPPVFIPYHERMNARWDFEDKGIPYPEKFGNRRRFPVAPMPREVPARAPTPRLLIPLIPPVG